MERNNKYKVTVIIPAYNAERYIERCISSVLNQTLKDIEIIIIDDGSTDNTGIIIDRLIKGYNNAHVIHQENKGLYKTREIGLSLASGEYIGWIDADDYVEHNMFKVLYSTAIENDSELVICDYSWIPKRIGTKEKWFREYNGKIDTTFVERNSQPWNKIVKHDLLERLSIAEMFVSCFDEIYIRVLIEAKNPITINQQLYYHQVGIGTMSASYSDISHYRDFVEATKELRSVMSELISDPYWNDYFEYRVIYYHIITMVVAAYSSNKDEYEKSRNELHLDNPAYWRNQHYWNILKRNYGAIKAILIGAIVPLNYNWAKFICKAGIKLSLRKF